MFGIFELIWH